MVCMLVLGDSHVRRLGHFMFNLPDQFRSQVHRELSPQVVILCVGGNDLCAPGACPLATASALHDAARACTDRLGVARVYVLEVVIPSYSTALS